MTKKNITITALVAVLVMSMAAFAFAGPGYGGKGYGRGCGGNGGYGYANTQLTPEKQAAVDKIVESYSAKFTELKTAMWTKQSTLQAMVNGGEADEKKIGKLTAEISGLRTQMGDLRDKMAVELEKETGIEGYGFGRRSGRSGCPGGGGGYGAGNCPGFQGGRG